MATPSPTSTGPTAAGSVAGLAASSQIRAVEGTGVAVTFGRSAQGRRGKREKSGLRFSRNAWLPSCASSVV